MYYELDRKPLLTGRWIAEGPYIEDIDFDVGQYINEKDVKTPIKYTLEKIDSNSEDHGPYSFTSDKDLAFFEPSDIAV